MPAHLAVPIKVVLDYHVSDSFPIESVGVHEAERVNEELQLVVVKLAVAVFVQCAELLVKSIKRLLVKLG